MEKPRPRAKPSRQADEGLSDEGDEEELDLDTLRLMTSDFAGLFGRVILDEGHKIKSVATGTAQSVALLKADHFI